MTSKVAKAAPLDEDGFAVLDQAPAHDVVDSPEEAEELAARRAAPELVPGHVVSSELAKRRPDKG